MATIKIMVPELLKDRGWNPMDLVRRASLAPGTAYRLANGEAGAITLDMLGRLCDVFDIGIGELLILDTDKSK